MEWEVLQIHKYKYIQQQKFNLKKKSCTRRKSSTNYLLQSIFMFAVIITCMLVINYTLKNFFNFILFLVDFPLEFLFQRIPSLQYFRIINKM